MRTLTRALALAALALCCAACYGKRAEAQGPPKDWKPEPFPARIEMIGAEIFGIDRSHSHVGFTAGFLDLSKVHGRFDDFTATILYDDERPERSSVTLVIDAASIDTGGEHRDKDLRGANFFDVEKHPRIVFRSTRLEPLGGERYRVHGDLTIKGVTKPIAIEMTRTVRRQPDRAWGNIRMAAAGKVTLQRKDFGIAGNEFWGDLVIADAVDVELEIVGNRFNYDRWSFQSQDKPSAGEEVWKTLEKDGAAAAAVRFRELKRTQPEAWDFAAGQLGLVINRLMQRRRLDDALLLLAAGIEAYSDEAGFYARSGEAQAALGHREEAIRLYEKAHALAPDGTEAMEMLRRLGARTAAR